LNIPIKITFSKTTRPRQEIKCSPQTSIERLSALENCTIRQMYDLYGRYCEATSLSLFESDMSDKDFIVDREGPRRACSDRANGLRTAISWARVGQCDAHRHITGSHSGVRQPARRAIADWHGASFRPVIHRSAVPPRAERDMRRLQQDDRGFDIKGRRTANAIKENGGGKILAIHDGTNFLDNPVSIRSNGMRCILPPAALGLVWWSHSHWEFSSAGGVQE
jgi:hypothetical protein